MEVAMPKVNPYYGQDSIGRAARVKRLFDRIAPRYDLVNDLQSFGLHRLWKRRLIAQAAVRPGERALDACCGTGDIALALAARGAQVTGVDFSAKMLDKARARGQGESRLDYLEGDAAALPIPSETFDLATIAYGLRNLPDFGAGLAELVRVLRPGGRLLVLDFGKPPLAVWRRCYFAYLRWITPLFGRVFCGDAAAYSYILESLKCYPAQEGVAEAMKSLGMVGLGVRNFLGGIMSLHYGIKAALPADSQNGLSLPGECV